MDVPPLEIHVRICYCYWEFVITTCDMVIASRAIRLASPLKCSQQHISKNAVSDCASAYICQLDFAEDADLGEKARILLCTARQVVIKLYLLCKM
jgi:hypothetical protein